MLRSVNKMTDLEFAEFYYDVLEAINDDPLKYFVEAPGLMNFKPSPCQRVIFKTFFEKELDPVLKHKVNIEGVDANGIFTLSEILMTEVQIYEFLTEKKYDPSRIGQIKVNKIDLILGRRAGKTIMSAILAIYCAVTKNWKPYLSKTKFAHVLILSHSKDFSDEILGVMKELIKDSMILSKLIDRKEKQTSGILSLGVPFLINGEITKSKVQIKVGAASRKTTRGTAACAVLCDEIAHWNLEEGQKETDEAVITAVRPNMKQFGEHALMIKLSSPSIKQGVLYKEYESYQKGELPKSYEVFKAPTWMINPIIPVKEIIEEAILDPHGFDSEYRANFVDSMSNFITAEALEATIQKGVTFLPPSQDKGIKYFAAIDAAYKSDRFTFSLVGVSENRVTQYLSKGFEGTREKPVRAFEVAQWVRNATKNFPINEIGADQYSFQPLKEIFDQFNLTLKEYTFSATYKKKIYFNLKKLINSQQLDTLDNPRQTKEIKELIVEQSATGNIKIGHPPGGTDDFADSLAVSALMATESQGVGKFEFEALSAVKTYDIKVDRNGTAFTAPSPEMLASSGHLGENISDNSSLYGIDPEDGVFKKRSDFEDEDDGMQFSF